MPAAVHVLCGPAASGKTQCLLEHYRAAARAELKQNEVWPEQFAAAVGQRAGDKPKGKDWQCALLYNAYQERLIRHHLYDLEGRFWYARDLLDRGVRRPFEGVRAVFVDG